MQRLLPALLLGSALFAGAQVYDRPFGDRDYARQERSVFDHARMDLDHAGNYRYASKSDLKRFDEARQRLFAFESKFDRGQYDKHDLNEAIDKLQNVVVHNSLDPRDRGALDDDLRRMRDYRAFRDHKQYRDYDYGYRR